ncbi:redoxin family protein [Pelagibius sp. CAU 1746]|uniref:peroxiredoxin n=1 Tax=Pelagibius sp. CAU 1746 TaxID=3140370 RepID=UPI00325A59F7
MREAGERLPQVTFKLRQDGAWSEKTSDSLFRGRRVVLFALPAAFSTTCSARHLAGYVALARNIRAMSIDEIFCLAVNDAFVMNAWARDQGLAGEVTLLPDGSGAFTREMGMLTDRSAEGYGQRSRRYSLLADDGTIERIFVESREGGMNALDVSDAITMLDHLDDRRLAARQRVAAE